MRTSLTIGALCASALLLIFCCQVHPAHAGFLQFDIQPLGEPAGHGPPEFVWGELDDKPGHAWAVLNELFEPELGESYDLTFSGITDGDPIVTVTKNVTNSTSATWIGYNIDLDPTDTDTFVGTPTSDKFTLMSQSAYSLVFGLPAPVLPGQSVQFVFDVNVPDVGPFGFNLSQRPIVPEPASTALIGLAGVMVAGWYRRRRAGH